MNDRTLSHNLAALNIIVQIWEWDTLSNVAGDEAGFQAYRDAEIRLANSLNTRDSATIERALKDSEPHTVEHSIMLTIKEAKKWMSAEPKDANVQLQLNLHTKFTERAYQLYEYFSAAMEQPFD